MKKEQLPTYALALAILIVGLGFAGVPLSTLIILPLVLACPLMMFFMMRGMDHGGMSRGVPDSRLDDCSRSSGCGHHHDTTEQPERPQSTGPTARR